MIKGFPMPDFAARRVMMVDNQIRPSDVTMYPVIAAFLAVPREIYVPASLREAAYLGENIPLAPRRTLLEARTQAKLLDALNISPNELVLDIGCGLGYSAAILAHLAEAVVAVEPDATMAAAADAALVAQGHDNVLVVNAELSAGSAAQAPFDVIVVEGAIELLPQALADQLRVGGRIGCLFMEGNLGVVRIGTKTTDGIVWRDAFNASAPILPGFERETAFVL